MNDALLISNIVLWVIVVGLSAVVVALARQIGVLHERVSPAGALMPSGGPEVGESAPILSLADLNGKSVNIGGRDAKGRRTLLLFVSPSCPVCKTLLPTALRVAADEAAHERVVLLSDGSDMDHGAFVAEQGLSALPYIVSPQPPMAFRVGKLPYAVLIDSKGVIRAAGIVNTREHLESLFEADERDVASVQDFLERRRDDGGSETGEAA